MCNYISIDMLRIIDIFEIRIIVQRDRTVTMVYNVRIKSLLVAYTYLSTQPRNQNSRFGCLLKSSMCLVT